MGAKSEEIASNQGDRWTFLGVLPDTSFIHTVHHGKRNLEEAIYFIGKIKASSDGKSPLFSSDDWCYEKALLEHYGYDSEVPYGGRGRYPKPIRLALKELKLVQVQKKRDSKGALLKINYFVRFGDLDEINAIFKRAERCKSINTVYVESRNGKFRKDDARLIRRTLCHSKKSIFHDAQANFIAQVMNYTRTNEGLRIMLNPDALNFEQKYTHRTPAMAQNLIDKPLSIKELLCIRPRVVP